MRTAEPTPSCSPAREWLSAHRDGESGDDPVARAHVDTCQACTAWSEALDVVAERTALRTMAPDVAAAAIAAFDAQAAAAPRRRQATVARVLLGLAGGLAVLLSALGLTDAFGTLSTAGSHIGRELYAFEAALGVGFLMAAWKPLRYAASLLPITAVVIVAAVLPSAADLGSRPGVAGEATHLPVLLGLGALLLLFDATRQGRGRRRIAAHGTA
jgi:predicted anti-sigma-YlaC factor YlaD